MNLYLERRGLSRTGSVRTLLLLPGRTGISLWRYKVAIGDQGRVKYARIVPPTSQNQSCIEENLRHSLERVGLDQDPEILRQTGKMVIRNYDPCISCATHFLKLSLQRQ